MARQPAQNEMMQDSENIRRVNQAIILYSQAHDGELPSDLASIIDFVTIEKDPNKRNQEFARALLAPGIPAAQPPADAKPDWVNQNSSYVYLGGTGIKWDEVPGWSDTVVLHLKLDAGHATQVSPQNPEGQMFTLTFLDNHTEIVPRAEAMRLIDQSKQVFEAMRTGGPLPDDRQASWDLQHILDAVNAYAKAHNDQLPPNLGDAFPNVPADKQRLSTPAKRAAIFLSPEARRNTHVPDDPTPDWINRHTSYSYLAAAAESDKPLLKARIEDPGRTIIICGKPDWAIPIIRRGGEHASVVPLSSLWSASSAEDKDYAEAAIAESRKVIEAIKRGTPLPDYEQTVHDLRLLLKALNAYARAHNGDYPPDLASTVPYLPEDELPTVADKAKVYLSPKAERLTHVPDELTADWVNKNANYVYLAAGTQPVQYSKLRRNGGPVVILLHTPLNEASDVLFPWVREPPFRHSAIARADTSTVSYAFPEDMEQDLADSRKEIEAARNK